MEEESDADKYGIEHRHRSQAFEDNRVLDTWATDMSFIIPATSVHELCDRAGKRPPLSDGDCCDGEGEELNKIETDREGDKVLEFGGVGVTDGEEEEEGEGVGDTEGVGVRDGVAEDEGEGLGEGDDVELGVIEGVRVSEGVLIGVTDGVWDFDGGGVREFEGLREGDGLELGKTLQKRVPVPGTTLNTEFGGQFSASKPGTSQAANVVSPAENPARLSKPAQCTVVVQCISCVIFPA